MSARKIDCPVCGFRFDPADNGSCGSCPLNTGCEMVCCPNCGHTTVDLNQSGLVRLTNRIVALFRREQPGSAEAVEGFIRLAGIPPGGSNSPSPSASDQSGVNGDQSPAAGDALPVSGFRSPIPGFPSSNPSPPSSPPRPPIYNPDPPAPVLRLSEIPVGERVRVMSLGEGLSPPRCARLQAYGVVPGYWVRVIQHDPVTVIQVDHLELAMEGEVAEGILVQE